MRRQDRQKVKQWLAELQPHANRNFRLDRSRRKRGTASPTFVEGAPTNCLSRGDQINYFPTDEGTIRRYFAWCKRHILKPGDRIAMHLYWGVTEGNKELGSPFDRPNFSHESVASMEHFIGTATSWLSDDLNYSLSGKPIKIPAVDDRKIKDSWEVVVEWFTADPETQNSLNTEYTSSSVRYDEWGDVVSRSPGRYHKQTIRIVYETSIMHSLKYSEGRVSTYVKTSISYNPPVMYSTRCQAKMVLTPSGGASLYDLCEEIAQMALGRDRPRKDCYIRLQPYSYHSRKAKQRRQDWQWSARQKRRERRQQAREITSHE